MSSPNPILTTIIFVFGLQAMLLSVLLLVKRPRVLSNVFLALLVVFFSLMALNIALVNVLRSYDAFHIFRYFQLELLYGIGPALYFYSKSITDRDFTFSQKDFIHFLPVVLEFIFYRTTYYRLGADGMYQSPVHPYTKIYLTEQWLGILSISVYTILSLRILYHYQLWLRQQYSHLEKRSLYWLQVPVIVYATFWIGWNVLTEIDRYVFGRTLRETYFLPVFVGLAMASCWIGFKGYLRSQTGESGYSKSKSAQDFSGQDSEWAEHITGVMERQHPYLDPDLDLTRLSELLEMNPKQVSYTINHSFSKNFYEFVNHYRVEAFQRRMTQPDSAKLTLLAHALESGFKSKSTFNDAFKKITGITPSEYVKRLKKESEGKHSVE